MLCALNVDSFKFVALKKNTGPVEERARDWFYAPWLYRLDYTSAGERSSMNFTRTRKLWEHIVSSQIETRTPYIQYMVNYLSFNKKVLFRFAQDACNRKSNQQNLGILIYARRLWSTPVAVCNLGSIALNRFVTEDKKFDFKKLHEVLTRNLNKIIEVNYYPVEEARRSNFRHRPIGLGVQGLADAFMLMRYPFTSPEASRFEPQDLRGCLVFKGILQFDKWNVKPTDQYGVRNSLLIAPMPTASNVKFV
ncbi:ribonucleotide reductase, barrel domain protein [Cooperia oncophora]